MCQHDLWLHKACAHACTVALQAANMHAHGASDLTAVLDKLACRHHVRVTYQPGLQCLVNQDVIAIQLKAVFVLSDNLLHR